MNQQIPEINPENEEPFDFDQPLFVVLGKIYFHGILALLVIYALVWGINVVLPLFQVFENRFLRVSLALVSVTLLPPVLGALIRYGIYPLISRRKSWARLTDWDEQLYSELTRARSAARVVIVDWPNAELRTVGVLTRSFTDETTGEELAAVYLLSTSRSRHGYIHLCKLSDVTMTNWNLKEWQLFQLTLGAFGPDTIQTGLRKPDSQESSL